MKKMNRIRSVFGVFFMGAVSVVHAARDPEPSLLYICNVDEAGEVHPEGLTIEKARVYLGADDTNNSIDENTRRHTTNSLQLCGNPKKDPRIIINVYNQESHRRIFQEFARKHDNQSMECAANMRITEKPCKDVVRV